MSFTYAPKSFCVSLRICVFQVGNRWSIAIQYILEIYKIMTKEKCVFTLYCFPYATRYKSINWIVQKYENVKLQNEFIVATRKFATS